MSTQQLQLVCDSSTLANYKAWAKPISDWFRTAGYTNTSDSGQLNGAGGGTGGAAGWAALAATPGSAAYFYEIFQSGSGSTTFYVKAEYGNVSGTNCPSIAMTIGTGTSGAGALTGTVTSRLQCNPSSFTAPSTSTQYECDFTADTANDRIGVMMWRNAPTNQGQEMFAIERSLNSSGTTTNSYVTLWTFGFNTSANVSGNQQSIVFGVGAAPALLSRNQAVAAGTANPGLSSVRIAAAGAAGTTTAFNGTIPLDTAAPSVGYWDYPSTMVGAGWGTDYAEGVTFTVTLYGSTRTYMPSKIGPFSGPTLNGTVAAGGLMTCMRYD